MVSKNNAQMKDRYATKQVPHYGIRKLSIGVASVLLSTTLYMGVTAHADTTVPVSPQPTIDQPASTATGTSTGNATDNVQLNPTADQSASTTTNSPISESNVSSKPVQTVSPEQPADTTDAQASSDQSESAAANSNALENNGSTALAPTVVIPKQAANADTQSAATTSGVQPFVNLAVESDNNDLTPKHETIDSQWTIHYVNQADHQQELKDPTVITMQYTRTDTPQSDGKTQYGDWSYVPGSFKQTGTPITVNDSDNPVKQDNVDKDGENMDVFTITAMYPTITGYTMHNNINGTRLHDYLRNNDRQADTMSKDFYTEYDVAKERSVAIKFVDDQSFNQQVGQAITLTGRDGDTVDLKLTIPDKYQLADGQQLPTTYTFAKGSGDLKIHLVHKVVQREAAVNVQLIIMTGVSMDGTGDLSSVIPQSRWKQLDDELKDGLGGPGGMYNAMPLIEVGTLTGHVNYDLVDNEVLSFGNDWTSLNLDGHTYQLPNGDDVVNGITFDPETASGKKLKEEILKTYQVTHTDVDSDYVNRPWHGYLSVNATNNSDTYIHQLGLQTGLVGNEPNALAKATDDRAATSVEMSNKPIDLNFVQTYDVEFSEQDGQLRAKVDLPVGGVYVPYVEKTAATRTINVTTPDGKTTAVKQTATLTKQIDLGKDAHQDWTTGEWENYEVPAIPGYTASQSNVSKETVTGTTEDQTVNITYTANEHQISVEYVDNATGKILKTDHVSGKTGQTVSITPDIPDGWELVSGQSVPSEVTVGADGAPATVIKVQPQERSVAVKFVDDQSYDFDTSDHKAQVGQAITVTGRDGDTVDLKLTIPDKYQLADGQQLPTTYTFAKGSGDLKIHLVHKVVQLKATVDVKLNLLTAVSIYSNHERPLTVTQDQWKQMEAKAEDVDSLDALTPSVKAGTLTGHVNYDLVYGTVVSFGDDWTSLNLGGQTYQLPNGDEVVNGVMAFSADYPWGKTLKEFFLKDNTNTDSDYANRPWHGYLSVNATNNAEDIRRIGLQAGLVGDEFNALAKATGDRAATGIEMANTTIDLSWLQRHVGLSLPEINEQDGQVKYHTSVDAAGVYIPYVEKTATRTINVITPDGKTTTVKQTATLAKQVDLGKDAHPAWTTGEWTSYDVPTIPGYTASQSNVAKETVTGITEDQTINITYTANPQKIHINYVDAQRKLIHTTTVNGQTDQTVKVPNEVPDGWILYSGQNIPKSITFQAANNDRDYVVKHVQSFVLSTAPKEAGTIIEGTKAKTYPAGVSDADLNKTITRTILVKDANGRTVNTKTQTVHFVRNAVVDAVTGHVEYLGWSEDGSHIFATYIPVPKNGYTINSAKTTTVTPNDTDSTIELAYKPIPKTITVEYMTTDGKQIASQAVKADDNNQVKFVAPDGYVLATNTNTVDVSDLNNNIYRVLVRANEQNYTAGSTNIPENVKNLTKVVTRTIVIVMPNGHRRTIKQRVTFERTATIKSDGSVVYTDYQPVGHDAFNHIFIAHRFGYNLNFSDGSKSVTRIDHVTADTPDQTIVVTYARKNAN